MKRRSILLLVFPLWLMVNAVHAKEVVVVTSFPKELFENYKKAFEAKYPGTTVVVGDGAARLSVRTASGSIEVSGPPRADAADATATPPVSWAEQPTSTEASPEATPEATGPDPRLAVLEAVERGEVDVDEALRRLARLPGEADTAGAGPDPAPGRPGAATQESTGA